MDKTHLLRKGQSWYVRVRVPPSLKERVGKNHLIRSLQTKDLEVARSKRWAVVAEFKGYLDAVKQKGTLHTDLDQARMYRGMVALGKMDENTALMNWAHHNRSHYYKDDQPVLELVETGRAIIKGEIGEGATPISVRLEDHLKELSAHARKQTVNSRRTRIEGLLKWTRATTFPELNKRIIGGYISHLLAEGSRSPRTVREHLTDISAFLNWCVDRGFIDNNPAAGVSRTIRETTRGQASTKRRPWTTEELQRLQQEAMQYNFEWLRIIQLALYSGMRLNEICEMKKEDVSLDADGKPEAFYVREGKNENSIRHIPIHPVIKGNIEGALKKSTGAYLIEGLKRGGADNKRHHYFAKRFSAWSRKTLGFKDPGTVFHSFRMNFAQALENTAVTATTAELLLGHRRQSMSYGTYSKGPEFEKLAEAVGRVSYM